MSKWLGAFPASGEHAGPWDVCRLRSQDLTSQPRRTRLLVRGHRSGWGMGILPPTPRWPQWAGRPSGYTVAIVSRCEKECLNWKHFFLKTLFYGLHFLVKEVVWEMQFLWWEGLYSKFLIMWGKIHVGRALEIRKYEGMRFVILICKIYRILICMVYVPWLNGKTVYFAYEQWYN